MIEEMDIQEGKYLEFAELFKSMNIDIDRLVGMRQQIIVNTYYQRYVRPQQTVRHHRLTEAEKEKDADYTLCNCGRYVSNVTPKFALKHLNTAVHYQGVRNRKYAHTTFNNEEINAKIKTEVVLQCFIIKHLSEVRKRIAETAEEELSVAEEICLCENCFLIECCCEADRLQVIQDDENARANGYVEVDDRWVKDEEEDTGEIYIGRPTVQMGLNMLREFDSDEEDEKEELSVAEEDEKADEEEELSVAEEFRQGLLEPENRIIWREMKGSWDITVNAEIKFIYGGGQIVIQGVIEKITKKIIIIKHVSQQRTMGRGYYKKEKMNIIAVAIDEL